MGDETDLGQDVGVGRRATGLCLSGTPQRAWGSHYTLDLRIYPASGSLRAGDCPGSAEPGDPGSKATIATTAAKQQGSHRVKAVAYLESLLSVQRPEWGFQQRK